MKHLNQFITEYIVKKKLDKFINSGYTYFPKTRSELVKNIKYLLSKGETNLNCIDTSEITDMSHLFDSNNTNIVIPDNIDISEWNLSNVTNIENMFRGCKNFNCDLSNWNVSKVENMRSLFYLCENFEGKGIENWNVSNVTNMAYMFYWCKKFNCNLIGFDTSNVTNMNYMFALCYEFKGKGLENWDVSNVKYMKGTFHSCKKFEGKGLENWKLKSNCNIIDTFTNCDSMINKPSWYEE